MPPLSTRPPSRIVIYHQTHHKPDGTPISILPLISQPGIRVTHVNIAAIHINECNITLNDNGPEHPRYAQLWTEVQTLQASGVKVLGMLGGAAKGSYARLDRDQASFETYYAALYELIRQRRLDGLDLDIEEPMSLEGVIRLIDRLKMDFGDGFLITLAPVAAALISVQLIKDYAEFSYEELEVMRGHKIAWYNTQFYCGWGDISNTLHFDLIMSRGFPAHKVVVGLITNPANGPGFVPFESLSFVFAALRKRYPGFGGVMAWEYFNSLPGAAAAPWTWADWMTRLMAIDVFTQSQASLRMQIQSINDSLVVKASAETSDEAPLPSPFLYHEVEQEDV